MWAIELLASVYRPPSSNDLFALFQAGNFLINKIKLINRYSSFKGIIKDSLNFFEKYFPLLI